MICVDVAHGHHILVERAIKTLRSIFGGDIHIMAGNVATLAGFNDLLAWDLYRPVTHAFFLPGLSFSCLESRGANDTGHMVGRLPFVFLTSLRMPLGTLIVPKCKISHWVLVNVVHTLIFYVALVLKVDRCFLHDVWIIENGVDHQTCFSDQQPR